MFIYYKAHLAQEEQVKENNVNRNSLETRIESSTQSQIGTTERWKIKPARIHTQVTELRVEANKSKNPEERKKIEKRIHEIKKQNKPYTPTNTQHKKSIKDTDRKTYITDLNGQIIGTIYRISGDYSDGKKINIGNSRLIEEIGFDFTTSNQQDYYIRTFAKLKEEGIDGLKSYLQKSIRNSLNSPNMGHNQRSRRVSKKEVKRRMRVRDAYDIKLRGKIFHVNLKGKIELFSQHQGLKRLLIVDRNLTEIQIERARKFTEYADIKKWIYDTTPSFNAFVGKTFQSLAIATQIILRDYSPRLYTADAVIKHFQ